MRRLMTLDELSNDVDARGKGSTCVMASIVSIPYGCQASFQNAIWTSTYYMEKHSVLGKQTEDYR
jgi:hypothetical protein